MRRKRHRACAVGHETKEWKPDRILAVLWRTQLRRSSHIMRMYGLVWLAPDSNRSLPFSNEILICLVMKAHKQIRMADGTPGVAATLIPNRVTRYTAATGLGIARAGMHLPAVPLGVPGPP